LAHKKNHIVIIGKQKEERKNKIGELTWFCFLAGESLSEFLLGRID
jgi:hypothetical protein